MTSTDDFTSSQLDQAVLQVVGCDFSSFCQVSESDAENWITQLPLYLENPKLIPMLCGLGMLLATGAISRQKLTRAAQNAKGHSLSPEAIKYYMKLTMQLGKDICQDAVKRGKTKSQITACGHYLVRNGNELLTLYFVVAPVAGYLMGSLTRSERSFSRLELPDFIPTEARDDAVLAAECATRALLLQFLLLTSPAIFGESFDPELIARVIREQWKWVARGRELVAKLREKPPLTTSGYLEVFEIHAESMHEIAIKLLERQVLSVLRLKEPFLALRAELSKPFDLECLKLTHEDLSANSSLAGTTPIPSLVAAYGGIRAEAFNRSTKINPEKTATKPNRSVDHAKLTRAIDCIREQPGLAGKNVATRIGVAWSTFKSSYVPALKELGVTNSNGYRLSTRG